MNKVIITADQLKGIYGEPKTPIQEEISQSIQQEDGLLKSIAKAPIKTLLVRPGQRVAEAIGRTGVLGQDIKTGYEAFADEGGQNISTIAGDYNIPTATGKGVAGEALDVASYAVPVGRVVGTVGKGVAKLGAGKVLQNVAGGSVAGIAGGYTQDVATDLMADKSIGEALTPGIGTAIGAGLPIAGKGLQKLGQKLGNFIETPAKELQNKAMEKGVKYLASKIGSVDNTLKETTYTFIDNVGNKKVISPIDTFAKYNLYPEVVDGSVNVQSIYDKVASNLDNLDNKIDDVLTSNNKKISIDDFAKAIEDEIRSNPEIRQSGKVQSTINDILPRIEDWKMSYGNDLDILEINNIRKTANKNFKKERLDVERMIGNSGREIVYNATEDKVVRELLNDQRALINAENFATRLKGKAVKGGRLGNYVMSGLGATIGKASTNNDFIGTLLGAFGGRTVSEFLQSRAFRSLPADIKSSIEKVYLKSPKSQATIMTESMIDNIKSIITKKIGNNEFLPKQFPGDYILDKQDEILKKTGSKGGYIKNPLAKSSDNIATSIQKAKAESKTFDEWVNGQSVNFDDLPDYAKGGIQSDIRVKISNEGASIDLAKNIQKSQYIITEQKISELQKTNPDIFKDTFTKRGSVSKGPIVIDEKGVVIDGNNRVREAFERGDKTIKSYEPLEKTRSQLKAEWDKN